MNDDRYEVLTWRGHLFDRYTIAAIEAAEFEVGHNLTVMQGSYNGGAGKVSASAGTHDGGGAVDFGVGPMVTRDIRVLRSVGFAAWHRVPSEGPWGAHVHCILIGNTAASPGAKRQVESYRNGRNGLATNLRDDTWRPTPIPTFDYTEADMNTDQLLDALESPRGQAALAKAVLKAKVKTVDAPDGRPVDTVLASLFNHLKKG